MALHPTAPPHSLRRRAAAALAGTVLAGLFGLACQPSIGDSCFLSTDCSQRGDRLCDRSQVKSIVEADSGPYALGGYCTVFNCNGNGCPDEAACVVTGASVPGCGYTDRGVARSARSFCLKTCLVDSDCRTREGYVCRAVVRPGSENSAQNLEGTILDDDQSRRVCVIARSPASTVSASTPDAAVCQAAGPGVDAAAFEPPRLEAGTDASGDASDGGAGDAAKPDGSSDAGIVDAATDGG